MIQGPLNLRHKTVPLSLSIMPILPSIIPPSFNLKIKKQLFCIGV